LKAEGTACLRRKVMIVYLRDLRQSWAFSPNPSSTGSLFRYCKGKKKKRMGNTYLHKFQKHKYYYGKTQM
jgi:hypothetical protein